jgi:hypothetical protein
MKRRYRKAALKAGFRSGLEQDNVNHLEDLKADYTYEAKRFPYTPKVRHYTPDVILGNGIIVEIKGYFSTEDRSKHKLIKAQYPEMDLRFVFNNPGNYIRKGSKTTYSDWCDQYGFKWAQGLIPKEWINEK